MTQKITTALFALNLFAFLAFRSTEESKEESTSVGNYSISLNVKDLSASLEFYQKLGFEAVEGTGGIEQNWMMITNGTARIGLFQGMFPSNTITFNPSDGRAVYQSVKEQGIEPAFEMGMENTGGPCTFSISDPDGNPILIDQH